MEISHSVISLSRGEWIKGCFSHPTEIVGFIYLFIATNGFPVVYNHLLFLFYFFFNGRCYNPLDQNNYCGPGGVG